MLHAMRALILTVLTVSSVAGAAPAQVFNDPSPYAQSQQDRMEALRQRSDRISDYSRQYNTDARLTLFELAQQRRRAARVERLEPPLRSIEAERAARERATTAREETVDGVTQIDDWLNDTPR